ncbi:MAG: hypothetical protein M0R77_19925 [Gammaproteobacteria bacterium]|nr:hypothetical protein [Gammaproteobacteria bacterium]
MDIERLFATTVKYIYEDHYEKCDRAYKEYHNGVITKKKYDDKVKHLIWERQSRIVHIWENLSPEDQITFYTKCSAQEVLLPYLTTDQAAAIIIIQDQLVLYSE